MFFFLFFLPNLSNKRDFRIKLFVFYVTNTGSKRGVMRAKVVDLHITVVS